MAEPVQVTICIPCYALCPSLYRTLKSIEDTADMPYKLCLFTAKESVSWNRISCLKTVTTPYVIWMDDDVLFPTKDWMSRMIKHFDNPKVGMVGIYVMHWKLMEKSPKRPEGVVSEVCGAVMGQRLVKGVYPDTRYLGGQYEDTDLCFQMKKAGYEVIQDNTIHVIHFNEVKQQQFSENQKKFMEKWHNNGN